MDFAGLVGMAVCLVALTVWTIYSHPHETHGVHTATYPHKTHGVHTGTSKIHTGYIQLPPQDGKRGVPRPPPPIPDSSFPMF